MFSWFPVGKMKFHNFWPPLRKIYVLPWKIHYCPPGKNPFDTHVKRYLLIYIRLLCTHAWDKESIINNLEPDNRTAAIQLSQPSYRFPQLDKLRFKKGETPLRPCFNAIFALWGNCKTEVIPCCVARAQFFISGFSGKLSIFINVRNNKLLN